MTRITKEFFSEKEAKKFEEQLFNFWPKSIDKRWFWLAFQALEKTGLTYYETDEEEMQIRERLTLLAIFYYEFCHVSAFHESEHFKYWSTDLIKEIKKDFSSEVDDQLFNIRKALISYFGSEQNVISELWLSCLEGSLNCLIPVFKNNNAIEENNVNKKDAEDWFIGWGIGIEDFMGISL